VDEIIKKCREDANGEITNWGLRDLGALDYDLGPSLPGFQGLVEEMLFSNIINSRREQEHLM
jgi:hypothetical protein